MTQLCNRIKACVQRTFVAANIHLLTSARSLPFRPIRTPTPISALSHYSYKFTCCQMDYVGRTNRCLIDRIEEHVPKGLDLMITQ